MSPTAARLAVAAALASGLAIAAAPPAAAAVCVPRAAGTWCYAGGTELFCIEGNRDPVWVRLVDCPY